MVFEFTLQSLPEAFCYMGRDKYENEELIKWGWPEDFWFHVDNLSSAHVYLRMPKGFNIDDLRPEVVEECCQLTKANSIQGCKQNDVRIVYTYWSNLKKTQGMDVGQVGFHDEGKRRYFTVAKKDTTLLNKLEKTRVEKNEVDFRALREERDGKEAREDRAAAKEAEKKRKEEIEEEKRQKDLRNYTSLMTAENMQSNDEPIDEDDFM